MSDAHALAHLRDDAAAEVHPISLHLFTSLAADCRLHSRPLLFSEAVAAFRGEDERSRMCKHADACSLEHCEWTFELDFAVKVNLTDQGRLRQR